MICVAIIDPQFDRHPDSATAEAGAGVPAPGTGVAAAVLNCHSRHMLALAGAEEMERERIVARRSRLVREAGTDRY